MFGEHFIRSGTKLYKQFVGIPLGTNSSAIRRPVFHSVNPVPVSIGCRFDRTKNLILPLKNAP